MELNKEAYPSLDNSPSLLEVGWKLKTSVNKPVDNNSKETTINNNVDKIPEIQKNVNQPKRQWGFLLASSVVLVGALLLIARIRVLR